MTMLYRIAPDYPDIERIDPLHFSVLITLFDEANNIFYYLG